MASAGQQFCWSALLLFVYYSTGCLIFTRLEREAELQMYANNLKLYDDMEALYSLEYCKDPAFADLSFCRSQAEFSVLLKSYFNSHGNSIADLEQWTYLGSLFFLTHLATTVGYGSANPQTSEGRLATIVYLLIGVPIMGYVLAQVARFHLRVSATLLEKSAGVRVHTTTRQIFVLWCLLLVFLFGGAMVYSFLEPWSYLHSLYFCFVTLSTVGFGDFMPSSDLSKAFSIVYIISGLGVCASIIAVMTGLVAEGHHTADNFAQRLKETCDECNDCTRRH